MKRKTTQAEQNGAEKQEERWIEVLQRRLSPGAHVLEQHCCQSYRFVRVPSQAVAEFVSFYGRKKI